MMLKRLAVETILRAIDAQRRNRAVYAKCGVFCEEEIDLPVVRYDRQCDV